MADVSWRTSFDFSIANSYRARQMSLRPMPAVHNYLVGLELDFLCLF